MDYTLKWKRRTAKNLPHTDVICNEKTIGYILKIRFSNQGKWALVIKGSMTKFFRIRKDVFRYLDDLK